MGPARLQKLLATGSPREIWERITRGDAKAVAQIAEVKLELSQSWSTQAQQLQLDEPAQREIAQRYADSQTRVARHGSLHYPHRLTDDPEPPGALFWKGQLEAVNAPATIGVVGTRACTSYGMDVAFEIGRTMAQAGVCVISGLALGIDAAAHKGALSVSGASVNGTSAGSSGSSMGAAAPVGVVGSGLDMVYPKANRKLWEEVAARGALVSESPLGVSPEAWRFPARNRIIAALSDVVVVVESKDKGGALYTAEEAAARDRPVFAVPGPIRSMASQGTNKLLAEGCHVMCDVEDLLVALDLPGRQPSRVAGQSSRVAGQPSLAEQPPQQLPAQPPQQLPAPQQLLLEAFEWQPASLEQLTERTGLTLGEVADGLEELQAANLVVRSGLWYERRAS